MICFRHILSSYPISKVTVGSRTVRRISTTGAFQNRALIRLKKLQADFQCEDGKPIWLKGGFCDRILYTTTIVLCYVGVVAVVLTLYDHAKPESWKTSC